MFYIKFNALAKSSHQPHFFFNFKSKRIITVNWYAVMSDILTSKVFNKIHSITWCTLTPHFVKFTFCQICAAIFWSQSFQHTPLNILVTFESGVHVFRVVLCRNAWDSAIHLSIIWFTDILAYFDIQTELQDCLYEYGYPRDVQVSVATRCFCRVIIFVSS